MGAMKAEVTDNNGQKYSVETILGANELYDVAKFKITAKTNAALFVHRLLPIQLHGLLCLHKLATL